MSDVVGAWKQSVPHQGVQGPVQIQDFSPVELAEGVKVVELLALEVQVQLRDLPHAEAGEKNKTNVGPSRVKSKW